MFKLYYPRDSRLRSKTSLHPNPLRHVCGQIFIREMREDWEINHSGAWDTAKVKARMEVEAVERCEH